MGSSSPRAPIALAAVAALAAGAIVAQSADGASSVRLRADANGKLRFDKKRVRASPGRVTVVMRNPRSSGQPHAIEVEGHGVERRGGTVGPGGTSRVTVRLKRGRYEFYCPVDRHKQAGMRGTLVVR
jgi:plastocyanin